MISFCLVLLLTPAAVLLSVWIRSRIALPLLTAIAAYFPFLMEAQNSVVHAFLLLLWWAALLSVSVGWLVLKNPAKASDLVWRSREYTQSMFHWIDSGKLPEGSGPAVVLFHVKQTLIYCLLALFSANFLALVLGSALLNYMNFYVLSLYRERSSSAKVLLMAWNPWSVIRVLAFLYLGIVLSTPSLWLLIPVPWTLSFVLFLPGIIGIVLDVVLKLSLSRSWSTKLRPVWHREFVTQSENFELS